MIAALTNHLWQSTLVVVATGLLTRVLRQNHARTRYAIWLAASIKFLIPFAWLVRMGHHFATYTVHTQPVAAYVIEQFGQAYAPIGHTLVATIPTAAASSLTPLNPVLAVWLVGCGAVLLAWWIRWRRSAAMIGAAEPLQHGPELETLHRLGGRVAIVSSSAPIEPGVFGIWRPVLFWPAGISRHLTDSQLEAILAHEVSHIQRRDNLTAAIHVLVEALFWFHPLVWWIGTRLVEERENACDEAVLRSQAQPRAYAEGILKVCEYCLEAPLLCVSGVSGSDLTKRIQAIVSHRAARDLGASRKCLLALAAIAALIGPIFIGLWNAPPTYAQALAAPPPPVSQKDRPLPQFEVASIKPAAPDQRGVTIRPGANGGININNMPVKEMMVLAWRIQPYQISGGPAWIESARYDINATGNHKPKQDEIPLMIQSLLADRFQLKIHHETKELPIYALVLANKDGRLGPQLTESKEGSCSAFDPTNPPPASEPGKPPVMGCGGMFMGPDRVNGVANPISQLAPLLARMLGRTVVDKTGLTGKFDVKLQWTPDQAQLQAMAPPGGLPPGMPAPQFDPNGPSIFTALQEQLGLKLDSEKGPVDILIIDHVEKPSEN
jgi:bla regulator protein BlaR1